MGLCWKLRLTYATCTYTNNTCTCACECSMQNVAPCPSKQPPDNYTFVIKDSEKNVNIQTSLATGSVIRIVVNDLMEDTQYWYYVVATNQFGSSNQSASVEISMTL